MFERVVSVVSSVPSPVDVEEREAGVLRVGFHAVDDESVCSRPSVLCRHDDGSAVPQFVAYDVVPFFRRVAFPFRSRHVGVEAAVVFQSCRQLSHCCRACLGAVVGLCHDAGEIYDLCRPLSVGVALRVGVEHGPVDVSPFQVFVYPYAVCRCGVVYLSLEACRASVVCQHLCCGECYTSRRGVVLLHLRAQGVVRVILSPFYPHHWHDGTVLSPSRRGDGKQEDDGYADGEVHGRVCVFC